MTNNEIKLDKKATDYLKGKFSKGGVQLVDTLPEVGNENTLYKTPDGKIWSYTTTVEEKVISDLEVGKSYKFKDEILVKDIRNHLTGISGIVTVEVDDETYFEFNKYNPGKQPVEYTIHYYADNGNRSISYECLFESLPEDLAEFSMYEFTEIPSVTITQTFVDNLEDVNTDLLNIAFLFEGGSHTEEITTSTWTEVGSGSSSSSKYVCTFYDFNSVFGKHFDVDAVIALLEKYNFNIDEPISPEDQKTIHIGYNNDSGEDWTVIRFGYNVCVGGSDIYLFGTRLEDLVSSNTYRGVLTLNKEKIESIVLSRDNIHNTPSEDIFVNSIYDWHSGSKEYISFEETFSMFKD